MQVLFSHVYMIRNNINMGEQHCEEIAVRLKESKRTVFQREELQGRWDISMVFRLNTCYGFTFLIFSSDVRGMSFRQVKPTKPFSNLSRFMQDTCRNCCFRRLLDSPESTAWQVPPFFPYCVLLLQTVVLQH